MEGEVLYVYSRRSKASESGHSIEYQKEVGKDVSIKLNFSRVEYFDEGEGVSGSENPFERKISKKLIEGIKQGTVKHLFFYEWTRMSRDSTHSTALRDLLKDHNVTLYQGTSARPLNLHDPDSNFQLGLMFAFSEYEKENMIKRIKQGLHQSRMKMKWSGSLTPWGYRRGAGGVIEIDEEEAQIYYFMVDLLSKGKSVRFITNELNKREILPKSAKTGTKAGFFNMKNSVGETVEVNPATRLWRDNVVRRILTTPLTKGVRVHKSGKEYPFLPLIDEVEWNNLQSIFKKNVSLNRSGNKPKHNYLLKNILFHKSDGKKLLGRIKKDERTYYCCGKRKEIRLKSDSICDFPSLNLDRLEKFVWSKLTKIMSDSHLVREAYKKQILKGNTLKERTQNQTKINDKLKGRIQKIKNDIEGLIKLHLEGRVDLETFDKLNNEYRTDLVNCQSEFQQSQLIMDKLSDSNSFIDWLKKFSEEVKSWDSESVDFDYKRNKIEEYVSRILIDYDFDSKKYDLEIYLKIPMVDDKLKWVSGNKRDGYSIKSGSRYKTYKFDNKKNHISKNSNI